MITPPPNPHDLGGRSTVGPNEAIDLSEKPLTHWDWQMDAMVRLLFTKGVMKDFAELRRGIEALPGADYASFTYYEKWAFSVSTRLLELGLIQQTELEAKIEAVRGQVGQDS